MNHHVKMRRRRETHDSWLLPAAFWTASKIPLTTVPAPRITCSAKSRQFKTSDTLICSASDLLRLLWVRLSLTGFLRLSLSLSLLSVYSHCCSQFSAESSPVQVTLCCLLFWFCSVRNMCSPYPSCLHGSSVWSVLVVHVQMRRYMNISYIYNTCIIYYMYMIYVLLYNKYAYIQST